MENCYAFKLLWVLVYAIGCDEIKEEWSFFENTLSKSSLKTDPLKHICPLIEDTKLNSSLVNKSLFSFWYSVAYPLSQYWNDCRHRHFKKLDHTRRWLHIYGTIGILIMYFILCILDALLPPTYTVHILLCHLLYACLLSKSQKENHCFFFLLNLFIATLLHTIFN